MEHITLRIASINHPPYVVLNETDSGTWKLIGGVDAYVINILKEKFSFKYKALVPMEREWGNLIDGRWTGVIGMVYRNEVDLGMCNMMFTESRYNSVAFSVPYNSDGWFLISLAPRVFENQQAVVQPFEKEVWFALFLTVMLSTCLLLILEHIGSRFKWTPKLSWKNTLWNVVAVLCQEGVKLEKMQSSTLVYFIFWIVSAMILQFSYSGTLIGCLTFPAKEPSIASLNDLAVAIKRKGFKISIRKFSLAQDLLAYHEKYGDLFSTTVDSDLRSRVRTQHEGFQLVLKEKFVYIGNEFGSIYDSYEEDIENFQMSSIFNQNYIAIAVSRKFQYLKDFNIILRRLSERGLIMKWRSDILHRRLMEIVFKEKDQEHLQTEDVVESKSKPLKVTHLRGAFILLAGGSALGFVTLIAEILYMRYLPIGKRNF